ncbi:MAG: ester cyclase [Deltaproteobacteria bacterium]|nr:ester cyclase [Deltaproteobacteria bacterium]
MRTRAVVLGVAAVAALLLAGCGGRQRVAGASPHAAGTGAPQQPPAHVDDCLDKLGRERHVLAACRSDDATFERMDGPGPLPWQAVNTGEISALEQALPDLAIETLLVLRWTDRAVVVTRARGTHRAALGELAPTGRALAWLSALELDLAADGRVRAARAYQDGLTLYGQLGLWAGAYRSTDDAARAPSGRARGDTPAAGPGAAGEPDVAMINACLEAWNRHDQVAARACYSADAVLHDLGAPADVRGGDLDGALAATFAAFPDGQWTGTPRAAGPWVVVAASFSGTRQGALPALGLHKTSTPVAVTSHELHLFQLAGGRITEHWIFRDALALARKLGVK